jgi:hypothetical protein
MLIELSLTVNEQDYNDLVSGNRIAILYRPYPLDRKFILTPLNQGEIITNTLVNVFDREPLKAEQLNESLASLLNTSLDQLKEAFTKINNPVLLYLRAYSFTPAIILNDQTIIDHQALNSSIFIDNLNPILTDQYFSRKYESIQKIFLIERRLKETEDQRKQKLAQELGWIETIAKTGNDGDGNKFEKLVRKSFVFLGFNNNDYHQNLKHPKLKDCLNPEKVGGAGGLDIFCEFPYFLVGECKATTSKSVPVTTPAQLIYLGKKHLQNDYDKCIKVIIAAGRLTSDAALTAKNNHINIMRPEILEKIIVLKAQYPGSVDLFELKKCLENEPFGEDMNNKLLKFINKIEDEIKLRSEIVQLVKKHDKQIIIFLLGVYSALNPLKPLTERELYNILIELSSPLAGYLGREKCNDNNWKNDRFYFLRDLNYPDNE